MGKGVERAEGIRPFGAFARWASRQCGRWRWVIFRVWDRMLVAAAAGHMRQNAAKRAFVVLVHCDQYGMRHCFRRSRRIECKSSGDRK